MSLVQTHAGELYSLASAVLWAISIILFKLSGHLVRPIPLNLYKNTIGLVLLVVTMFLAGMDLSPSSNTPTDWFVLLLSGLIGIGIADTLLFMSLNNLGAGRFAVVDCLYSPFVILCSSIYLSEPFGNNLMIALALLIGAIFIGTWHTSNRASPHATNRFLGVVLGILATFLMAASLVMIKPILNRSDPFWTTMVRLLGGFSLLIIQGMLPGYRAESLACFKPGPVWKIILPSAVIGTYLAMFCWIAGMSYTYTTTASVLNQTSIIFLILLATLVLKEPLTKRKVIALLMGITGGVLAIL